MNLHIITIYCLCDDYIQSLNHKDWPNAKLSSAEIMLIFIVAMRFFYGNIHRAKVFLFEAGYIKPLSDSALNRRIHKLPIEWWTNILKFTQRWGSIAGLPMSYILDAFPVSVCRNIRIRNCRVYQGEEFRGYNKSKREWFYGIKVTAITTAEGYPVQVLLCPGREHDSIPFKFMELDLPEGSRLYADSAYLDYELEDRLMSEKKIKLIAERKSNSLRHMELEDYVGLRYLRGNIEQALGQLSKLFPRTIHVRTAEGFELKILGFIIAFATTFILS